MAGSNSQTKLRSNLVVSQQETAEGITFVVKDPETGRYFRLRETEHFIAQQLDGSTPLEIVRQKVEERFGAPLAQESLEQFTGRLGRLGLLEAGESQVENPVQRRGRIRGSLLYLRLKAFDPDRLFDRLIGQVRFFFTPHFLVLSSALILFAFGLTVVNSDEIGGQLRGLFHLRGLFLAWLTILVVTAAHEFAHGLTCKHFGGAVHEMGFLLIYFQPALYCNVSDAWMFPEKSKKLWVTFAGAYFELFLWALATITWRVTDTDTALNYAALVVMASSAAKSLFNLNPLIKLDGYYLLSDYLEIPNLRQRAFGYLRARIRRAWGATGQMTMETGPRERRIYLAYGLLAAAFSYSMLGLLAVQVGGLLIGRYQGLGLLLFTGLLLTTFRAPLQKGAQKLAAPLDPGRRSFPRMKKPTVILISLGALSALLFLGRIDLRVGGEFTVLPSHNADVRAEVEGIIGEILVEEGDRVRAGDPIARLADRDYRAELRKIEAELAEKRAKLKMLNAGPRREEIELARREVETAQTRQAEAQKRYEEAQKMRAERLARANSTVEKAQERLKYARNYLTIFQGLFHERAVSRKQIEEAEEEATVRAKVLEEAQAELKMVLADDLSEMRQAVAVAEKQLEEPKGKLKVLLAGSRPEEIEATEAEVSRLEAQAHYLEDQLQRILVLSPIAGVITTPKPKEKVGQHVNKGDLIAKVHALDTVRAEISLSEKEIADVRVGQEVTLKARAYPEMSFAGTVTAIAPAAVEGGPGGGSKVVRVTTEIGNASHLLKPEMTGNAKISSGKRSVFDLMARRLARYIRVEVWSWW